jgi:glutamate-ammonia-ligase adenylyltransferase
LLHLGIEDQAQALKNLEYLQASLGEDACTEVLPLFFSALSRTADPDMTLNNFERFVSGLDDVPAFVSLLRANPAVLTSLLTVFGASGFLSTFLVSHREDGLSLLGRDDFLAHPAGAPALAERLDALLSDARIDQDVFRVLRAFRRQEMLRIGLRDLLGKADLQETVTELSDLAEVCLQKAYHWADGELRKRYGRPIVTQKDGTALPAGFAVIAMGKLGGRELNFSSDVDLMYVYSADGETEGPAAADGATSNRITNHQYFIKLGEKLSAAIGEKTGDGFVFRVDMRLRPEGQRGPLAQSLGGYEIYYESWGQTWERSALIKARPVAGDESVGREFLERITPFVYRKYLDYSAIAEIRDMKQKINKDVEQKGRTHRDVKLGYGGIREIEFVVQALQLIYAGRDRSLREKNALKALHMLAQKGLITYQERADLSKAYVFLRTVEHRIQILDDLQTQTMPLDDRELRTLARRSGYLQPGHEAELLLRDYADHTHKVRSIYNDLFAFTGEDRTPQTALHDYDLLLDASITEQESVAAFARFGFRDPGKAYRNLLMLREGPAFVHQTPRSRKLFNDVFPSLFHEIASSPDPDMALNHLESFLAAQGSWESFQSLVRLNPDVVKTLIAVFANSEYLSRMLISRPVLIENLFESRKAFGIGTARVFSQELTALMDKAPGITEKLDALRRFKHREEIRLGMADLLADAGHAAVSRDLSKLAEACLAAALALAGAEIGKRYALDGSVTGLAVIGVGKLGGRELTYASDLDILFVFSEERAAPPPAGLTVFEYFSKIAEKTIAYLSTLTREGYVFRVDTRLRPTGSKGPLVQSLSAVRNYYAAQAETWERQAMLRAHGVAGDPLVGREFCRAMHGLIYRAVDQASLAKDIRSMRKRMEEEVGKENAGAYNIKQGVGGLVDIEFLVQYLQLFHGSRHAWVRVPGTMNALRALHKERLLAPEDYSFLAQAYRFMRMLESRMRIVTNQATSELARDPEKLRPLARRMGYDDDGMTAGQKLLLEYERISAGVRNLFERIVQV